jgi:energy-converting hydrogenase Eha subunit C
MVLFMEGGCDYGVTNIFFFSKLGLIVWSNVGVILLLRRRKPQGWVGLVPYFLVLAVAALGTLFDSKCATYYDHPQGSTGQMVIEIAAWTFLGIALVKRLRHLFPLAKITGLALWNGWYVLVFYAAFLVVPHWAWRHTWIIATVMVVLGGIVAWNESRNTGFHPDSRQPKSRSPNPAAP